MRVILLGPQRRPTVDAVARSLGLPGPGNQVATITAGWQEREPDDQELSTLLGARAVNLSLYRRWLDVQDRDPQYAAAERELAGTLAELQDLYLLRLDYALQAVYAVQRRSGPALGGEALAEAVAAVRELDAAHLRRVDNVRGEFFQRLPPHDRPVIAGHRAAVAGILGEAGALVIAGGHVGVLAEVLHLFNVAAALGRRPGTGDRVVGRRDGAGGPDRALRRPVTAGTRSPRGVRQRPEHAPRRGAAAARPGQDAARRHAPDGGLRPAVRTGPLCPA